MSTIFQFSSLTIFVGILVGTFLHHKVKLHVKIMKLCFALDLCLLVAVEIFRGAVEQMLGLQESRGDIDRTMLAIHIPFAVTSLVWWFIQVITGAKILKGRRELLARHSLNAKIFLLLRLGNLVTAFLL